MLAARIYGLIWLFTAVAGAVLYFTGSFNTAATFVYGFIVSILGGAALLVVFPVLLTERHAPAYQSRRVSKTEI